MGISKHVLNRNKQAASNLELTHRFLFLNHFLLKNMGRLAEMQRKLLEVGELRLFVFVKFGKTDECLVRIGGML